MARAHSRRARLTAEDLDEHRNAPASNSCRVSLRPEVAEAVAAYVEDFPPFACSIGVTGPDPDSGVVSNFGTSEVPTELSLWQVASITKTFTGTLIAKLYIEGELDLEAPVSDLLPEAALYKEA